MNWAVTEILPPKGRGLLRIYHPQGDDRWTNHVRAFYAGELQNVQEIRRSREATVYRGTVADDDTVYFFKRLNVRAKRFDRLKHLVRKSRGKRALMNGEAMTADGIRAPEAVCLVERLEAYVVRESLLVTAAVAGARSVYESLLEFAGKPNERRALIRAYAAEVGRMHRAGWFHGDMRTSNSLYTESADGFSFCWLDNERNRKHREIPDARRVHNLVRANMERGHVTLTDRMRFWRAYVEAAALPPEKQPGIRNSVVAKTRRRWKDRGWI